MTIHRTIQIGQLCFSLHFLDTKNHNFFKIAMKTKVQKIKIGITGRNGFIGSFLTNTLTYLNEQFKIIDFERDYFSKQDKMLTFVKECNVIVHLAGINRNDDEKFIYQTNISLTEKIIKACELTNSKPHIIFSSSTQENKINAYGKSKKISHQLFSIWSEKNNASYTGLIIPNVFGPFCKPNYNSVVATFCNQLTKEKKPEVLNDSQLFLIYVGELVEIIINKIQNKKRINESIDVNFTKKIKVSELLKKLTSFKNNYFEKGVIPDINSTFDKNLFNTFLCYIDHEKFYPFNLIQHKDNRGSFVETIKLNSGGQISFSTTKSGITRGNHFHTRKAERFTVIKGKARIDLRKIGSNKILTFDLDGESPSFVDMPVWHTHNITNIGKNELLTIFWINEPYDPNDSDTFFEKV